MASFAPMNEAAPLSHPLASFPFDHDYLHELGMGANGFVDAWSHRPTGTLMAVKNVRSRRQHSSVEVEILRTLPHHPSICKFFGYINGCPSPSRSCLFFELCPVGDLHAVREMMWERNEARFSEAFLWSVFSQLSSAIAFLHEGIGGAHPVDTQSWRPVVHRDIKLENVFVSKLGSKEDWSSIVIKLGDFGFSRFYSPLIRPDMRLPGGPWGTTVYWPPEQTWGERLSMPAGDVWAVGTVIHELAHGFLPIIDPEVTKREWFQHHMMPPYDEHLRQHVKDQYWGAVTPRRPVPINLSHLNQDTDSRSRRPTPQYSDRLNQMMMAALDMSFHHRIRAGPLYRVTKEENLTLMLQDLIMESNKQNANRRFRIRS